MHVMDDVLLAGAASLSGQVEAAVKACEAETGKVGQDYYTTLSSSSPAAAKGPAAGKGAALAKGKAAKEEAATPAEVGHKNARNSISSHLMVVVGVMVVGGVMVVVGGGGGDGGGL